MQIVVVGAGAVGLACAIRLGEAGHQVQVWTKDAPSDTASAVPAVVWWPDAVAYGGKDPRATGEDGAIIRWSAATYDQLATLTAIPGSGVRLRRGSAVLRAAQGEPWWAAAVPRLGRCRPALLPDGYADGYAFAAPVVDMWQYLPWLIRRLAAAGVPVVERELRGLADARMVADLVVNCSGLGARQLAEDGDMVPVRSQVVRVANVGLTEWLRDDHDPDGPISLVPRGDEVVCGGTVEAGAEELAPRAADTDRILARCCALVPELAGAPVVGTMVGVWPGRTVVRLDRDERDDDVVHCYGHGGAGITLSWGCADEVTRLVAAAGGR